MKTIITTTLLLLTATLGVHAQNQRVPQDTSARGPRERPSAEVIATKLMGDFDANQDGLLDQTELTTALEAMHQPHRMKTGNCPPPPPPPPPSANEGNRPPPPPPADEQAANWLTDFDLDGNLQLDETELTAALESMPPPPPPRGRGPQSSN